MAHLAMSFFGGEPSYTDLGLWAFLTISAVAMFAVFLPLVAWIGSRQKEREAFYKAETFRRLAESSSEGAKMAIELLREQSRLERLKHRQGVLLGGMINIGVGAALVIFLTALKVGQPGATNLCGLIPGFIGVAMVVYALYMTPPVE